MTKRHTAACFFAILLMGGTLAAICYAYDKPPNNDGRTLTPAEKDAVGDAVWEIMTPPPDSIPYVDGQGNTRKVSCSDLGQVLWNQLWSGRIEAETKAAESTVNHVSDGPFDQRRSGEHRSAHYRRSYLQSVCGRAVAAGDACP